MTELKLAVSRSQGVGFLEDHSHAMKLDARSGPQLHHLSEAMATMQASLKNMKDQLVSELVMVGTVNFISRSFTKNWLTTQDCNDNFLSFLDAVSSLALVHDSSNSAFEQVSYEGKLKPAGHSNRNEAILIYSFEVELPAMFGKDSTPGVLRDGRVLSACPTVNEWDAGGRLRGAKYSLATNLEKATVFSRRIGDDLPGEAREVAREMLGSSVSFLRELSSLITRSGTSDKECWGSSPTAFVRSSAHSVL
jgi:hypothetical protein